MAVAVVTDKNIVGIIKLIVELFMTTQKHIKILAALYCLFSWLIFCFSLKVATELWHRLGEQAIEGVSSKHRGAFIILLIVSIMLFINSFLATRWCSRLYRYKNKAK
jgi:hypothetical protein